MKHIAYDCNHDHKNGHIIRFTWGNTLELVVDLNENIQQAGVLVAGELKDSFSVEGMTIADFEAKIEELQEMADQLSAIRA